MCKYGYKYIKAGTLAPGEGLDLFKTHAMPEGGIEPLDTFMGKWKWRGGGCFLNILLKSGVTELGLLHAYICNI